MTSALLPSPLLEPRRCAALDLVPDDPASAHLRAGLQPASSYSSDSVRFRLNALTAPLLRLLLTVLAALPDSAAVRADAAAFASGHHQLLSRLMSDAAGAGEWGCWVALGWGGGLAAEGSQHVSDVEGWR